MLYLFPGVFLSSRVTGACPVTTDILMRVNVRTTTTTTGTNNTRHHLLAYLNIILLVLTIPLQPSAVTNLSVKPDYVRYRTRNFVGKIHGTQPKSNTRYYLSEIANSFSIPSLFGA